METILSIPEKKKTAWPAETRPRQAEAWLTSLPLGNTVESATRLYQALFALNRSDLGPQDRFDIMEFYCRPAAAVADGLQTHFSSLSLPLSPKKKQLADFLSQLHTEMAFGYKTVLNDILVNRQRAKKETVTLATERSLRYLGQVLLRAYLVYMPHPVGVWREIHALYEFAERTGVQNELLSLPEVAEAKTSIARRYKQALLLGMCGPYQLPPNECRQVHAFLDLWADKAVIDASVDVPNPAGHFLVDLTADAPPVPLPKDIKIDNLPHLRALNALGLATVAHSFMSRLQQGETAKSFDLGTECVGSLCADMLRRWVKFWGLSASRQYSRMKKQGRISLCIGLRAVHFFACGQRTFGAFNRAELHETTQEVEMLAGLDLGDEVAQGSAVSVRAVDHFRVDEWQVQDESASGLALRRAGQGVQVRVGDLLGSENAASGQWRVGVARWTKSPDTATVEVGVEMISPSVAPVAVKPASDPDGDYAPALLLPAVAALRKPATLLLAPGTCKPGQNLHLYEGEQARHVKVLHLVERTGSFERVTFADVRANNAPASAANRRGEMWLDEP